nr:uncharacterized protein LOC109763032 [Aegilops tauschii subsp. strangulata]
MSDRQKGLINAVDDMFPDSEHRICVRHLYQNFHANWKGETLKNQLWAIARSNNMATWNKNMEKMKEMNLEAWAYLDGLAPNTWCRAFFEELPKCDLLLNNSCEVFNKWILDARELPILSMLRKIKAQLMTRWYTNRKQCEDDSSQLPICPKIKKNLTKTLNGQKVAMNVLLAKVCPRDPAEWQKTNGPPVEPPKYEKKAGRKKKKRIVHPSEKDEGTRFSKHGVIMHCSVCNSTEHNRRKCTVLHPSDRVPALEKLPVRRNLLQAPTAQDFQCTEMTITQIPGEDSSHTCSVMSTLFQEVEASQVTPDAPPGPPPECSFIALRKDELPVPRATTSAQFLKKKLQTKKKKTTPKAAVRQAFVPPRATTQASQTDAAVGVTEAAKQARRTKAKKVPKD